MHKLTINWLIKIDRSGVKGLFFNLVDFNLRIAFSFLLLFFFALEIPQKWSSGLRCMG